jgi:hypothetical protein
MAKTRTKLKGSSEEGSFNYDEFEKEAIDRLKEGAGLAGADWEALLLHLVPSWHQKGAQLAPLNWPENQQHTIEEIKKVPSWRQKGTKLLTKKHGISSAYWPWPVSR